MIATSGAAASASLPATIDLSGERVTFAAGRTLFNPYYAYCRLLIAESDHEFRLKGN